MNKVFLTGRLVKDPELKFTPGNGTAVVTATLAVDKYNTKTKQHEADFIQIVVWGKSAENLATYTKKGSKIALSGRIQTRTYENNGTKHYITEVVADMVNGIEFLEKKPEATTESNTQQYSDMQPVDDGDIPF